MKNLTKNYLKFCGINSITYFIIYSKLDSKIKEDGYEFVKNDSIKDTISNVIYLIIRMITPVYNITATAQLILILDNKDFYNIIKNRMISRNIIRPKKDNLNNIIDIKQEFDNSDIEILDRNYTKIKRK